MSNNDEPVVLRISNPSDFVEALTGHKPRSGVCILCGKTLVSDIDTDHSVCNPCWEETFSHPYTPWTDAEGFVSCDFCDEPQEAHKS
jgi:hypothetical protein